MQCICAFLSLYPSLSCSHLFVASLSPSICVFFWVYFLGSFFCVNFQCFLESQQVLVFFQLFCFGWNLNVLFRTVPCVPSSHTLHHSIWRIRWKILSHYILNNSRVLFLCAIRAHPDESIRSIIRKTWIRRLLRNDDNQIIKYEYPVCIYIHTRMHS